MNQRKTIGILGTGIVGTTLANGLKKEGYTIHLSNRKGTAIEAWSDTVSTYLEAINSSDIIILAVKGSAAEEVITSLKTELAGKTVIDTTNPITDGPPDEGVLGYFTSLEESLMERLQNTATKANFVKAFNSVGNALMVHPKFKDGSPTMFICGNNDNAKKETRLVLKDLGWESEDFGGVKSARAIEPLCILWCIPGMLKNEWSHAFKYLKS